MKRFYFLLCFGLMGSLMSCGGCQRDRSFEAPQEGLLDKFFKGNIAQTIPVTVANPEMQEVSTAPSVNAQITSSELLDVKSSSNIRVDSVLINEGDTVEVNTQLARYVEEDLPLKLSQLRAQLRQAESVLEKNNYLARNREELFQDGRMDRIQYDNIESVVEGNEAEVERLREAVSALEGRDEQGVIVSPIAGVVQSKLAQAGANYLTDATLFTIMRTDPLAAEFELPAQYLPLLQVNQALNLTFPDLPNERSQVTVQSVSSTVNPTTNTFSVKAVLANPTGAYKPGMRALVEVPSTQKQYSFFIPTEAILSDRNLHYVYTVINGVAHQAIINPKSTQGLMTEIASGLREDDLIVIKGQERLTEGTKVDIWSK